jgi:hypothetical protein
MRCGDMLITTRSGARMARLMEKRLLVRTNAALLRGMVVGGMVCCALAASVYDLGGWFGAW